MAIHTSRFRSYCEYIQWHWLCCRCHTPHVGSCPWISLFFLSGVSKPEAWLCPLRLIISPNLTVSLIQGVIVMHLSYMLYHPPCWRSIRNPGVVWSHVIRPQSGHMGWTVTELNFSAVWHVGVVRRLGSLLIPTDQADQNTTEQEQQGGGPAYIDGGAHLSLQGCSHQGVIVD